MNDPKELDNFGHSVAVRWQGFIDWRQEVSEIIVLPRAFVDIAGDVVSAVLLSQIVYWFMPNKLGETRLSVIKRGVYWLAKSQKDWFKECGITSAELAKARKVLEGRGLIETITARWNGSPTVHFRLEVKAFLDAWDQAVNGTLQRSPKRFARPDVSERNRANPPRQKQESIPAPQVQALNKEMENLNQENPSALNMEILLPKTTKSLTETSAETLSETSAESDGASALPVRSERAASFLDIASPALDSNEAEQPSALEAEADIPKPKTGLDPAFVEEVAKVRRKRLEREAAEQRRRQRLSDRRETPFAMSGVGDLIKELPGVK